MDSCNSPMVSWCCHCTWKEAKRVRLLGEACPLILLHHFDIWLTSTPRFQLCHMYQYHLTHPLGYDCLLLMTCVYPLNTHSGMLYSISYDLWKVRSLSTSSPDSSKNVQNYRLTSFTLFITHEPCIACSMAQLHSRVGEVQNILVCHFSQHFSHHA